ncbi:MAG TPA: ShlB/FhaC/HecB family hemolysin secretion/activation protein [Gemmatimonadaceae bacterium]
MTSAAFLVFAQITVSITGGKPTHADSVKRARDLARQDSIAVRMDSIQAARDSFRIKRRAATHIALTPELLATAFRDPEARALLDRARAARFTQDSALKGYDATTYERISVRSKITSFGRDRLLFRTERATRIRWQRGNGAVVDITGARSALPMFDGAGDTQVDRGSGGVPIPYYPGRETLWIGSELAKADADASAMIHPLGNGAEAYYTYATGDSVTFQLPGSRRILVRELRVQPRVSRWNLVVGSLWFDVASGQLVRGVYRMAEPMDVISVAKEEDGEDPKKDIPGWIKPMILPMTGGIDVMTVDYGLYEGRFWLPRMQTAEGKARAGVMRFPFELTQRFDYGSVNADMDVPKIQLSSADTAHGVAARRERRVERDSACSNGAAYRETRRIAHENSVDMLVRIPCDTAALARSPTLPKSIYDVPDSLFGDKDIDALVASALSLQRQAGGAGWAPAVVQFGLPLSRYNRIEGFSTGVRVDDDMGDGYSSHALARLGFDLSPNGELDVSRTNGRETYSANVYRRLNSANDWDRDPFSLSSSLSALLFGHDDGVYYRSWGGEIVHEEQGGLFDSWRLFSEQEFGASVKSRFSLVGKLSGGYFPDNIAVTRGTVAGLSLRKRGSYGEDPNGLRLFSDVRIEGAAGTFDYARAMADVTVTHPIGGPLDAALTLSGGTSGGSVPTQRLWYLGGASTIRGQDVGVAVGDAYWLTRLELGMGGAFARPVIFGDLGWAGDRHDWNQRVVPVSGAGVGASFMDGLIRMDLAKGIRPLGGVRASLYLDARF